MCVYLYMYIYLDLYIYIYIYIIYTYMIRVCVPNISNRCCSSLGLPPVLYPRDSGHLIYLTSPVSTSSRTAWALRPLRAMDASCFWLGDTLPGCQALKLPAPQWRYTEEHPRTMRHMESLDPIKEA